ncbi:MAG: chromosome segregation protein SMC [bacterium]
MFFSSLELIGFKSFKREKFTFDRPLTLFVGPNGCGKSNICDAIRWVLGEQNPHLLRAKSMPDLIFHGGEKEKPTSMAEVSILLDNSNNLLKAPFSDVKITRRVFPQGESVYMLNQKPCRLKDINELLLDTGLSQDGYFLMTQEKIELLLKSPDERLGLFEEASAIAGYRVKKEEVLGNLRKTLENITRLSDIMAELKRQGDGLKYQASKAKRYKRLKDELNIYKYHTLLEEYNRKKEELALKEKEEREIDNEIIKNEGILKKKREKFTTLVSGLKEKDNMLFKIREKKEGLREEIVRKEERLIFLSQIISSLKEKGVFLLTKEKNLKNELSNIKAERGAIGLLEENLEIKEKIKKMQEIEEEIKNELIDNLSRKAGIKGKREEGEREIGNIKNRTKRLKEEGERLDKERLEIVLKKKELSEQIQSIKEKIEGERKNFNNLKERENDILEQGAKTNKMINEMKEEETSCKHKISSISSLPLEKKAVERLIRDGIVKEASILEKMIEAKDEFAKAIDGFLADRLWSIVAKEDEIKWLISHAKKLNLGRIFIVLKEGKKIKEKEPPLSSSVIGRTSDLIKVKDEGINWLFSNLLIVKDIETALRFSSLGWKTVTIDGTRVENGIIEIGDEMGLLSRKKELNSLKRRLIELEEGLKELEKKREKEEKEKMAIIKELENSEKLLLKDEDCLKRLLQEEEGKKRDEDALSLKIQRLKDEALFFKEREDELYKEIASLVIEEENKNVKLLEERLNEIKAELKDLMDRERKMELQRDKLTILLEREKKQKAEIEGISYEKETIIKEVKEKEKEQNLIEKGLQEDKKALSLILDNEAGIEKTKSQASSFILEEEKNILQLEERVNSIYRIREEHNKEIKDIFVSVSLLNERINSIVSEYGEKIKSTTNSLDKQRAEKIEKELIRYCDVNLSSASEYDKIKERLYFYEQELSDLNKAKDDLYCLIDDLDKKAKEVFGETFKKANDNFSSIFLKIFGKGGAEIVMNNGKIDIEIALHGKKKKGLLLLSSGEKTLLAIVFLFSLFMVKPAPFCFLDEADASLDEANIKRFVSLIKLFSNDTQFLIITHNKRTIEIADTIYGITMETPGVSKALSMRLKNEDTRGSA